MIAAVSNTKALWYMTRATGVVTLLLLTLSLVLGITEVARWTSPRFPRFVTATLHKNVSLLVMVFLALHIVTAVADGFAPIRWIDVVVPFVSAYRPVWLGLGAVAFDLLVALIVTSILRQRIGYRAWRAVHWAAYACFPIALLHGLGTGSDTRIGWSLLLSMVCLAAVVGAIGWRIAVTHGVPDRTRVWAGAASIMLAALIVGFTALGPLAPGWARRAGTPTSLTGVARNASAVSIAVPFDASVAGRLNTASGRNDTTIRIDATLSRDGGAAALPMHIVLVGAALDNGGVAMQHSTVTLGTAGAAAIYKGSVVGLDGADIRSHLHDGNGTAITVALHLNVDPSSTTVTGTASAQPGTA